MGGTYLLVCYKHDLQASKHDLHTHSFPEKSQESQSKRYCTLFLANKSHLFLNILSNLNVQSSINNRRLCSKKVFRANKKHIIPGVTIQDPKIRICQIKDVMTDTIKQADQGEVQEISWGRKDKTDISSEGAWARGFKHRF